MISDHPMGIVRRYAGATILRFVVDYQQHSNDHQSMLPLDHVAVIVCKEHLSNEHISESVVLP